MDRRSVAVAVGAAVLALGCGGGDGAPATAPTVTFVEPRSTDGTPPEHLALPLTSLVEASRTDDQLVLEAWTVATRQCMAERGFDFPPYEDIGVYRFPPIRPFGPWTEADIADGYGAEVGPAQHTALDDFMATLPAEISRSWGAAYNGADPYGGAHATVTLPDGTEVQSGFADGTREGCRFRGYDAVYGDYAAREELRRKIEELRNQASVEAEDHDDDVHQALDAWHDCMEAHGVDVGSGGDGPDDLALGYISEPGVSDQERRDAELDVRCKAESNLHDAYFAARAEAEQRLIDENQVYVEAWRELVDDSLDRARQIITDASG